ncbi:MAG: hypothetical protein HYW65_01430 [Candidatus Liptonbacteria bacterium]|nr:hypothetical protein [Candidatus Liptonbacteria bacterium]
MTERQFSIITATGESKFGGDPDIAASRVMREMEFVPTRGLEDSPNLHKSARPKDKNTFVRLLGDGDTARFKVMRREGECERVLDEGKLYAIDAPTPSVHTTTFYGNGGKLISWEICCLPFAKSNATEGNEKVVKGISNPLPPPNSPSPKNPDPPPPKPNPFPPPPEDEDEPPQPPKPKQPRKPRNPKPKEPDMPQPNANDRLTDLRQKMDEEQASDSDIAAVIETEMDKEGKKGDNLAKIVEVLGRSNPWVYRYYHLRNLVPKLKPLIDEMGMSVAVEISAAPDFNQWNIWQKVRQVESPRERLKVAQQLCERREAKTDAHKGSAAKNDERGKRRTQRAHPHNESEGIAAIDEFVQQLAKADMNGGLTSDAFAAFVRSKTAGDLEGTIRTLEASRKSIGEIIKGVLAAYEKIAAPLLKTKH